MATKKQLASSTRPTTPTPGAKPEGRFKVGDRVKVKEGWRKHYVGCVRGEVIQATSLGIAVKVRWDGREIEGDEYSWVAMNSLEPESRR